MMDYSKQTKRLDINSAYLGVSRLILMENAGREAANLASGFSSVAVFCGAGNNGGDGLVAARHLSSQGKKVKVYLVPGERTPENKKNLEILESLGSAQIEYVKDSADSGRIKKELSGYDAIIDALLGVGASGELREPMKSLVDAMNSSNGRKMSLDTPTPGFKADVVLSFHMKKTDNAKVVGIGIPMEAELFCGPGDVLAAIPKRTGSEHKGDFGRVLVVGGSREYIGAPFLAARAATKSGVDLVRLACPQYVADHIGYDPNLIIQPLASLDYLSTGDLEAVLDTEFDSLVLGNGLAQKPETKSFVKELSRKTEKPMIVDADALKLLEERHIKKNMVLTPHAGEFSKLFGGLPEGFEEKKKLVSEKAKKTGAVIVLKGPVDVIAGPEAVRLNRTGNPGMTVGGTGDVLAGIIGAFAAKADLFSAACAGTFLCGLAGDLCAKERGFIYTATDVIEEIPEALRQIRQYE